MAGVPRAAERCRPSARAIAAAPRSATPGPRTYEELRAVLSSGTIHFPKRLRQVAIFLWQHPGEVALGTISEVAAQAGVQPSTLVRFAQTFGFAGFSEFQDLFKAAHQGLVARSSGTEGGPRSRGPASADLRFIEGLVAASQASLGADRRGLRIAPASSG